MNTFLMLASLILIPVLDSSAHANDLEILSSAPVFSLKTQTNKEFSLEARKGKWTVLYFYPKSETPGCTKQACAFRDTIAPIRTLGADVYGVSINSVQDQAQFHKKHRLTFDLLADEEGKVTQLYGAKMPVVSMAKRWTFIIDPQLKIRAINKDVDPVKDPQYVIDKLKEAQLEGSS